MNLTPNPDSGGSIDDLGPLGDAIKTIQSHLKPGGPEVDLSLVIAFIDKSLPPDEMQRVQQLIHTWHDWFWAYFHLDGWQLEADERNDANKRVQNGSTETRHNVIKDIRPNATES